MGSAPKSSGSVAAWQWGHFSFLRSDWTPGTKKNFVATLGKLEIGIAKAFGAKADFGRDAIVTGNRSLETRTHIRPFEIEDGRIICNWADQRADRLGNQDPAMGLRLAFEAGLRPSEVLGLRVEQVDARSGVLRDVEGKGGRIRNVSLTQSLAARLKEFCRGKQPGEKVVRCSERTLQRWVAQAKKELGIRSGNGVHGLRGAFARERVKYYLDKGHEFMKACGLVSKELGHTRAEVIRHYIEG